MYRFNAMDFTQKGIPLRAMSSTPQGPDVPGTRIRKPDWLKVALGGGEVYAGVGHTIATHGLHTICSSGRCPNQGECWSNGTASFLILGDVCTRRCGFCATKSGCPEAPDAHEPMRIARSVQLMGLKHAVITSVDRDDLPDGGAALWASVIEQVRHLCPRITLEALLPDFMGKDGALEHVLSTKPDIVAHNMETVERLTPSVRSKARYDYSLGVIERMAGAGLRAKSGLMLGLGEEWDEIVQTMRDLVSVGCKILTVGQYLQPNRRHLPVRRYYSPDEFAELADVARSMGFLYVESGPLVRSSFHAENALKACGLGNVQDK